MTGTTRPVLKLSLIPGMDHLSALELGVIDDGQPSERWVGTGADESVGLLHDAPDGRLVGFVIKDVSGYDPDAPDNAPLWDGPRVDVPELGLTDVPPNAVVVAARALYGDGPTVNRVFFAQAVAATGEDALQAWLLCLQAGDSMAHYALGYTLLELGRAPEAYRHLRYYAGIAPGASWSWCYYGRAAAAIGELAEAQAAYERAIEIGPDETDAEELLAALLAGEPEPVLHADDEDGDPDPEDDDAQRHVDVVRVTRTRPGDATRATLPADVRELVDGIFARTHVVPGGDLATVWIDLPAGPALLEIGPDRSVSIGAMVGMKAEAESEDHELMPLWDTEVVEDHGLVLDEEGTAWFGLELPMDVADLTPELLRILAAGVAATAAEARDDAAGESGFVVLPPTFDELVG